MEIFLNIMPHADRALTCFFFQAVSNCQYHILNNLFFLTYLKCCHNNSHWLDILCSIYGLFLIVTFVTDVPVPPAFIQCIFMI